MYIDSMNAEKYKKKIIIQSLKKYIVEWLSDTGYRSTFDLKETIDYCGQHKINMIIYDVESLMEEDENIEELADLLEVIYAILDFKSISRQELEKIRKNKKKNRGGFEKGLYLIQAEQ